MTVSYYHEVATSKPGVICRLLWRWKGSVWKAVTCELSCWLIMYYTVFAIYRFALSDGAQRSFEEFIRYTERTMKLIPLDFLLGFFVTIVINRWSTVFQNLGMIDNTAIFTSNYVLGNDERGRNLRRNIVRYCVLSQALLFRDINVSVRKRFPTLETLVAAGFCEQHELDKYNSVKNKFPKYWVPLNWALTLLNRAKKEGRVDSDINEYMVAEEIRHYRTSLTLVWQHDWISIPVLYPQVVFLATHTYFLLCLFSQQFIIKKHEMAVETELYFPVMAFCQFIFYMGWMKVAMALLNPMGEDDDDYDCNFLLDRNLTLALGCADSSHDPPEVKRDQFWKTEKIEPLYSVASTRRRVHFHEGSAVTQDDNSNTDDIRMVRLSDEFIPDAPLIRQRRKVTLGTCPIPGSFFKHNSEEPSSPKEKGKTNEAFEMDLEKN